MPALRPACLLPLVAALTFTLVDARIGARVETDQPQPGQSLTALGMGYFHLLELPDEEDVISHSQIVADGVVIAETISFRRTEGHEDRVMDFLVSHLEGEEGWLLTPESPTWWTDSRRLVAVVEKGAEYLSVNVFDPVEARRWATLQQLSRPNTSS